jgi:hypothetical protein
MNEEKFWKRVDIRGENECWPFIGKVNRHGYGTFMSNRVSWRAHRFSYTVVKGDIPKGLFVCHTCDNPICVNPSHLFLGTAKDNMDDCIRKGRARHNHTSKVSSDQIKEIRERRFYGGETHSEISKDYSVTAVTINDICSEKTHKLIHPLCGAPSTHMVITHRGFAIYCCAAHAPELLEKHGKAVMEFGSTVYNCCYVE